VEVDQDLLHAAAAEPVRLRSAREGDALGGEAVVFGELEVHGRRRSVHVPVLGEGEAAQLGAQHGERDIFEVRIGAVGAARSVSGCLV
jgi:hypothetical protein